MSRQNLLESKSILRIKPKKLPKGSISKNFLKKKPITRVGETANFVIDYDSTESIIFLYGKEAPTSHGFMLGLHKDEATAIIGCLKRAKTLFPQ
jgi:hypothetical protein